MSVLLNNFLDSLYDAGCYFSLTERIDALQAVEIIGWKQKKSVKQALASCLCHCDKELDIFNNIFQQYDFKFNQKDLNSFIHFETPGTILKYVSFFNSYDMEMSTDIISCINFLIKNYKTKKDIFLLSMMSFFIEKFYHNLAMVNHDVSNNKIILLKQIHDIKNYNLDTKNFFILLKNILENEKA